MRATTRSLYSRYVFVAVNTIPQRTTARGIVEYAVLKRNRKPILPANGTPTERSIGRETVARIIFPLEESAKPCKSRVVETKNRVGGMIYPPPRFSPLRRELAL